MDFFLTELLRAFNYANVHLTLLERLYNPSYDYLSIELFFFFAKLRQSELSLGRVMYESDWLSI